MGHTRILGVAPTGSGKTVISAAIVKDAINAGYRVLFLVHRNDLLKQTKASFKYYGIESTIFSSTKHDFGKLFSPCSVQLCTVQSLASNQWLWKAFKPNLVIADECHILAFDQTLTRVFPPTSEMGDRRDPCLYIGLTATPWRSKSSEALGDIFRSLVQAPTPKQLMGIGYLVRPYYFELNQIDLSAARVADNGEWRDSDLELIVNDEGVTSNAIDEWMKHAYKRPTLTFCITITHGIDVAIAFAKRGIKTAIVASRIPLDRMDDLKDAGVSFGSKATDRREIYDRFREGKIINLVSIGSLTEGFDEPIASCALILRPIRSSIALWHQIVGRVIRPCRGKQDAIVLDPTGNRSRHGSIESIESYELTFSDPTKERDPVFTDNREEKEELDIEPDRDFAIGQLALSLEDSDYPRFAELVSLIKNMGGRSAIKAYQLRYGSRPAPVWCRVALEEIHGDRADQYLWEVAPDDSPLMWRLEAG